MKCSCPSFGVSCRKRLHHADHLGVGYSDSDWGNNGFLGIIRLSFGWKNIPAGETGIKVKTWLTGTGRLLPFDNSRSLNLTLVRYWGPGGAALVVLD